TTLRPLCGNQSNPEEVTSAPGLSPGAPTTSLSPPTSWLRRCTLAVRLCMIGCKEGCTNHGRAKPSKSYAACCGRRCGSMMRGDRKISRSQQLGWTILLTQWMAVGVIIYYLLEPPAPWWALVYVLGALLFNVVSVVTLGYRAQVSRRLPPS